MRPLAFVVGLGVGVLAARGASWAGIEHWQVNEVLVSVGGDPAVRYVELRNDEGGCLFPTSRLEILDENGGLLGASSPVTVTTCFDPGTYYLFATPQADGLFGRGVDTPLNTALPATAGQVCFASSFTRYDCVRWGGVANAIADFFGPADVSVAPQPVDGMVLARIATTHIVADDWELAAPTPRGPNDGTPWFPPDAGPLPDAAPDAGPPDADLSPDARPPPDARVRVDAGNNAFLDVDPVGGATCGCHQAPTDPRTGAGLAALALALALAITRRQARVTPTRASATRASPPHHRRR